MVTRHRAHISSKKHSMEQEIEAQEREDADWSNSKDDYLRMLVSIHGEEEWEIIASKMKERFPGQTRLVADCRERWDSYLDPAILKQVWSDKEELEMLLAHKKFGNRWTEVATELKGKTNNNIKNKFYCIFRKVKSKILLRDYGYASRMELLEIVYMASIMEHYLSRPLHSSERKGRRGKNFIYTLLQSLKYDDVQEYKAELEKRMGSPISLEDLWTERIGSLIHINLTPVEDSHPVAQVNSSPPNPQLKVTSPLDEGVTAQAMIGAYTLPMPNNFTQPKPLTCDEKEFIMTQVFPNRGAFSAGFVHPQTTIMSPPMYRMVPFSAGLPQYRGSTCPYIELEAFSDFSTIRTIPRVQMQEKASFERDQGQVMHQLGGETKNNFQYHFSSCNPCLELSPPGQPTPN